MDEFNSVSFLRRATIACTFLGVAFGGALAGILSFLTQFPSIRLTAIIAFLVGGGGGFLCEMLAQRVSTMVGWGLLIPVLVSLVVAAGVVAVAFGGQLSDRQLLISAVIAVVYLGAAGWRIFGDMA